MSEVKLYTRRDLAKMLTLGIAAGVTSSAHSSVTSRRNLLGLRGAMMCAVKNSSKDVTDYVGWGEAILLDMWDGIRNAGVTEDHSSSSTTWKDLVGTISLTINSHGSWGDNCLNTDGSSCAAVGGSALPNDTRFIEAVLKCETNGNAITTRSSLSGNRYFYALETGYSPADVRWKGLDANTREMHYVAFGYAGDNRTVSARFLDGQPVSESTTAITDKNTSPVFSIGGRSNSTSDACKCSVCAIRVYSRVLTEYEVAYNYAVDKARFGLA